MSKSALLELAERVEKASGLDRELDRDILVAVRGMKVIDDYLYEMENWYYSLNGDEKNPAYPSPTSSLDAAMTLVPEHHLLVSLKNGDLDIKYHDVRKMRPSAMIAPHGFIVVEPNDILKIPAVSAETLPLALTAACLRASAHMETTDADK